MASVNYVDFYNRFPEHPKYNPNQIELTDLVDVVVQKVETILFTNKDELIGDLDFGGDLEALTFQTKVSASFVKKRLIEQFSTYIPELTDIPYELNVSFVQNPDDFSDILLVDFRVGEREIYAFFN